VRVPGAPFLLITLSATNGGHPVSFPPDSGGAPTAREYKELEIGTESINWFGLLREVAPTETKQVTLSLTYPSARFACVSPMGANRERRNCMGQISTAHDTDSTD